MSFLGNIFTTKRSVGLQGFTDWHCHILPGVDDGVESLDESLLILSQYEQLGIKKVWLTPHIMEDIPNTTANLRERFDELKTAYQGNIELNLAAENMMDGLFAERLAAGDVLPIGDEKNTLLVETSYFNAPTGLLDTLESITKAGYYPLIAHPERYTYVYDMDTYRQWKQLGAKLQLNLFSLSGHYGSEAKDKAEALLKNGMYDRVGSDLHHERHLGILKYLKLNDKTFTLLKTLMLE